ncbi:MAG: hypothetical protein ABIE07_07045 [Candidatus Zixiibacteriota bacterium]
METKNKNIDNNDSANSTESEPTPLYEYLCHPVKRNRTVSILVIMVMFICLVLTYFVTDSSFMTFLGAVILFGALSGFFFPTRYFFYEDHFIVKTKTQALRKEWSQYRSYYPDKNGVLLSPFARPTRLENFRGIYIKFEKNKDEVMKIVKSRIAFEKDKT